MPRLLVLTPSELTRDPRARRQAQAAVARGWEVVGLCGQFPDDVPIDLPGVAVTRLARGERTARLRRTAFGAVGASRSRGRAFRELRGLYQLIRWVSQSVRLWRAGRRLGRFDVVHANDLDTLAAGRLLARGGTRLVYDAHELYAEQEANPPRIHRAAARRVEGALARRAAAVATVSEAIAEELQKRFGLRTAPLVVLNCPERSNGAAPAHHVGPLLAIYQAGMGPGRPLEDLLDAAAELENVELALRVLRANPDALVAEIERRGLAGRVHVLEPVPTDRLVESLRPFDVGLIIDRPVSRNNALGFPNKLFEYLMAGLAVVVPSLPTMGRFVEDENVGLTFAPGDARALAACLNELADDRARLLACRERARAIALDRYNAEVQSEVLTRAWGA